VDHDVVISGAGPAGLMLATELAVSGASVLLVDRLDEPSVSPRALGLRARSLEVLAQRGNHWFDDAPPMRWDSFGQIRLETPADPRLISRRVPQRDVEEKLAARAIALGVDLRRGHALAGFDQDETGITVEVRSGGRAYRAAARYLVGCDGARSTVRTLAGIPFPGIPATLHGVNAQLTPPPGSLAEHVGAGLYRRGTMMVVPLERGEFRVSCTEYGGPAPGRDVPASLEELREKIRRVAGLDLDLGVASHISRFGDATRLAARYRSGRVFLAGDAAHVHFSSGGQGMNTGIQDAVNLGWKLAAAVHGWAPPGLLDTYQSERRPVGARVCWNTRAQVALYTPMDRAEPLRELFGELMGFEDVRRYLAELLTGVAIRYPMPYGTADPHPLLGARLPDLPLRTPAGSTSTARTLHAARGVLLCLCPGIPVPDTTRWDDRVDIVVAEPVPALEASMLLVRPDGHIAYADRSGTDRAGLRSALTTWFGGPGGISRVP